MSSATTVIATQAPREQWLSNVQGFTAVPTGSTATSALQPVIAVESVDGAQHHLLSYLALANPLYDLRLRIPAAILFSKPVEKILRSVLRQKRRFAYDRETSVLRLYAMSRPLHDSVAPLVSNFLSVQAVETGFLTLEEREHIYCSNEGVLLAGKVFHANQNRKKLHAWTKYPDTTIVFGDAESDPLPSVVFEAGFTESYEDLVSDAAQWLRKSGGKVRLVILVNIEEDVQSRMARQTSSEAQRRTRKLLTEFGKAKDREGIDHKDSDVESDEEMYDDIRCRIVVEDWVGPITAALEVWHMVNDTPELRSPRITVLPEPPIPQHPTIHITDIVPEKKRAIFEGFDESRIAELDMDRYRKLLISGTRRLAFQRAMNYLRPRDKDDDGEYIPEDHGSPSSEG